MYINNDDVDISSDAAFVYIYRTVANNGHADWAHAAIVDFANERDFGDDILTHLQQHRRGVMTCCKNCAIANLQHDLNEKVIT